MTDLQMILSGYDPNAPLIEARTPPSAWYTDSAFAAHEAARTFGGSWQMLARAEQLQRACDYVTAEIAGEPIVVVRDGELRAFYNVCRHHAARVVTGAAGCARALHCPYHGLIPIRIATWELWVFVCLDPQAPDLCYEGLLDVNLVLPVSAERSIVHFDHYF